MRILRTAIMNLYSHHQSLLPNPITGEVRRGCSIFQISLKLKTYPIKEIEFSIAFFIGKKLQILGAINIEFLCSAHHCYLMDINPRFSAGIAFSHLAGYDIVKNHFLCFQNEPIENNVTITPCYAVKRYITYITGKTI